ncbi:MAG: sugar phosphate isomerase/epimerase [Chloroflexota bacterium]
MSDAKPVAIQLYTVREALAQDWKGTLEKIAEKGYVGVETAGFGYAGSVEKAKAEFDRLGLQVVGAHSPLPLGENQSEIIETAKAAGSSSLICAGTGRDLFSTEADIRDRAKVFNEANAVCKANGLAFGLHNHWWEYALVNGRIAYDILLETLDDDIFFEIDTYWVASSGQDPVAEINKLGKKVSLLHIKDGSTNQADDMLAVGQGVMDFHKVIPAGQHAEWLVVELDRCGTNMMTAVNESYDYLIGQGLARGNA